MVGVFDENGAQMCDYQGKYLEKREMILRDAPPSAKFSRAKWGVAETPIERDFF
jgi:hypothetical protein